MLCNINDDVRFLKFSLYDDTKIADFFFAGGCQQRANWQMNRLAPVESKVENKRPEKVVVT